MTTEEKTSLYSGTYIVVGPPGCGKTQFLTRQVERIVEKSRLRLMYPGEGSPVMVCSLTRAAAAEIAGRNPNLPKSAVGTLHSHAYHALDRPAVAETLLSDFNENYHEYRLTESARTVKDTDDPYGLEPKAVGIADKLFEAYGLYRSRMVPRRAWPRQVQGFATVWEQWKENVSAVDFTDMIELALHEVPRPPGGPEVILADEAQDHSRLEYSLLRKWGDAVGALIIVGDPYQALYTWRGADPELFLDPSVDDDHRRLLSQSYRVPAAVHDLAMKWIVELSIYDPIEYRPRVDANTGDEVEGAVGSAGGSWKNPSPVIKLAEDWIAAGKSVMIMATCSYQIAPTVAILRKRGIPFANPWRVKRGDWNPLSVRGTSMSSRILSLLKMDLPTMGEDDVQAGWTAGQLVEWVSVLKADGLLQRGGKSELRSWADRESENEAVLTLETLLQQNWFVPGALAEIGDMLTTRWIEEDVLPLRDVLDWWHARLLGSKQKAAKFPLRVAAVRGAKALMERPKLYVGTVHSFKGAEADIVYLYPDLSPAGYREWALHGQHRDNIIRVVYVAITRAREQFYVCEGVSPMMVNLAPLITGV